MTAASGYVVVKVPLIDPETVPGPWGPSVREYAADEADAFGGVLTDDDPSISWDGKYWEVRFGMEPK